MHADLPRFTGFVEHALDDKGRLIVPARFRERLGAGFVLTIAQPDPCLALYPLATWNVFCNRLQAAPLKDEQFRRMVRHLFAHTEEVACDAQGRLVIPASLRTYAAIERDVISVGSLTRVEVWAKERFADHAAPQGEVGAFMAELGLY
ncbi:MAG: division/cell wall cluster transcriptional repressor MraZ [Candidatus Eremiobacteraeota bacterium]|nr:division/cell wall cluster transcriptional repressor MraZ [Candidatus Eremiobacteraeota bacterium]MBV9973601.1 division/cell wall cluster transcriptional repressor MraZ [Candidatus Eremiobacteraeota bacterium]